MHLSLGGFRVGVALVPEALDGIYESIVRIASETWSTVAAPIQYAAQYAFENHPEIEAYIRICTKIHRLVSEYMRQVLVELDIPYPRLDGGFYLYPDFCLFREGLKTKGVETSAALARHLIDEIQVVTLPGTAFGNPPEHLFLRLAPCDYRGADALEYIKAYPDCTAEALVSNCCPNIRLAGQRLGELFSDLR
jgi:aspartate/methionine/tyrosine aminotransferase